MKNIEPKIIEKIEDGVVTIMFTTSSAFVDYYKKIHGGISPQYNDSPANAEFRKLYTEERKRIKKKYASDYDVMFSDMYKLYKMHYDALMEKKFFVCLAIEDVFTDINYHKEQGLLNEGRYKDVMELTKKEEERWQ